MFTGRMKLRLDLLKFLGRRINRINSMLVATYRDDEVGADHPLRLVLGDSSHRSVMRLRLPPLSEAAVEQLAADAGRRVEDLHAVTGGNPFFVTEALASKESGVPVTVRDAVLSRAVRLSPACRAVLELVSVVPARTEMWLLDGAIRPQDSSIEECVSAGMLRCEGETISFRHELASPGNRRFDCCSATPEPAPSRAESFAQSRPGRATRPG